MNKLDELQNIADEIVAQDVCPELRAQATQLVYGEGDVDANIVFVGEAPGKKEDEQGRPFVGAAGKFLNEMLGNIGIKRDDVYITNIVKYRPPDNRDPRPEEKQAFWPILVRQLNVIQPKLVVTLGRHSMGYFLPNIKISEVHGELAQIKIGDRIQAVLPLFHPAAAMYNGGLRQTLISDFAKIPEIIKRIK
jgi:uracil-DNA glycosylase family 4